MTGNSINNNYRFLTKALEVVGFENATVHCNVATYSFNSRLSGLNHLDTAALDNLCKDLKKKSEEDERNLDFVRKLLFRLDNYRSFRHLHVFFTNQILLQKFPHDPSTI